MRISDWSSDVCSSDLHRVDRTRTPSDGEMQMQGLEGIKVLELAGHIAGACFAKLLAGFGAEVTRVEAQCPAPRTPEERPWLDTAKRLWNAKAPPPPDAQPRPLLPRAPHLNQPDRQHAG